MPQNQDIQSLQDVAGSGAESAQADHRVSPVEVGDSDETISDSKDTSRASNDIYRGMPTLRTRGKNVKAARESTLR